MGTCPIATATLGADVNFYCDLITINCRKVVADLALIGTD